MRILVCYKWVVDEADIIVDKKNSTLDRSRAKYKISEIDLNAIELGRTLKEQTNSEVISLTVGKGVKNSLKEALSRGIDEAFYIDIASVDSLITADILAAAIQKIGDVDVIICGEGSSDNYSQQTGPRIAGLLGYQMTTYADAVKIENNKLKVERKLDAEIETLEISTPAVFTVTSGINVPKVPGIKQILGARKKPVKELQLADIGISPTQLTTPVTVIDEGPSIMDRKQIKVNSDDLSDDEAAEKLVKFLRSDKVI